MKRQLWLYPFEWGYIVEVLTRATTEMPANRAITHIGRAELKRLAELCLKAANPLCREKRPITAPRRGIPAEIGTDG